MLLHFPQLLFGLLLHLTLGGWRQLGTAAAAGLVCGLIFLLFHLAGGMGGGDVKLITAAGCMRGPLADSAAAYIDISRRRSDGYRPCTLSSPAQGDDA